MQYSFFSACLLAFASTVMAQTDGFAPITKPTKNEVLPGGSPYTITWEPTGPSGKVSLILLQGATPATLQLGDTIAAAIDSTSGSYTWSVPSAANYATYGIKLQLDSDPTTFQYSNPFSIVGVNGAASAAVAPSSSATMMASTSAQVQSSTTQQLSQVSSLSSRLASSSTTSRAMTTAAVASGVSAAAVPTMATSVIYSNSTIVTPTGSSRASGSTATGSATRSGSASGTASGATSQQTINAAPGLKVCGGLMSVAAIAAAMLF